MRNACRLLLAASAAHVFGCGDDTATDAAMPDAQADVEVGRLPPGQHDFMIDFDGHARSYRVHVPEGLPSDESAALVLSIHGGSAEMNQQQLFSGFDAVADARGFVVVYPSSHNNFWDAGACCYLDNDLGGSESDDVRFFRELIDEVSGRIPIDERRIYATGMSTGGYMSYRLACEAADVIAAVAPVAGGLALDASDCLPSRPVAVMTVAGTGDLLVAYDADPAEPGWWTDPGVPVLSPQQSVDTFAKLDGCSGQPDAPTDKADWPDAPVSGTLVPGSGLMTGPLAGLDFVQAPQTPGAACAFYTQCEGDVAVGLCTHDGGHDWPTGTSTAIWEFFERHPMP